MKWPRLLAWDGVLPAAIAVMPSLAKWFAPQNTLAELSVVVLAPVVAALVRAIIGYRELGAAPPMWRQFLLGLAIALLLLFEGATGLLSFADDAPAQVWLAPALIYACYIACIALAFAPHRTTQCSGLAIKSSGVDNALVASR
jgi:hypothetical protein